MIAMHRPYLDSAEILAALRPGSGRSEFESAVADRLGVHHAVAFAYGHAGVIASLRALGLAEVDVVLPAYTCQVMADAVVASGNRPVFADIDLTDYNMNLEAMQAALTPRTRAIIATHMYGYPTNVDAIREAASDERVLIIEDRAMGFLTFTPGTVGLRGDIGLFSFGQAKQMFSVEGGVIATNSADLYEKIRAYRDREMTDSSVTLWLRKWVRFFLSYFSFGKFISPHWVRKNVGRAILPNRAPNNSEFTSTSSVQSDYAVPYTDFQARIGLSQLRKLEVILDKSQRLAKFYSHELRDIPNLTPAPIIPGATYAFYTLRVSGRDEIRFSQQMRDRGVDVGQVYDHVLPFWDRFRPYAKDRYPNTEQVTREVVNLPLHPKLKMSEAEYVVECIRDILC